MTRRELFQTACGVVAAQRVDSQELETRVDYRVYSRCLPDYLRLLADKSYQRRSGAIASLTTTDAIRQRQHWVRKTFWDLVGGMPERTPLNARNVGEFERSGYRVEKHIYESQPGFHITANLYIPAQGQPPFPGVLFQMGHSLNGKAAGVYQKCCQGLVQLGFVVLAFDPMGQGERAYYPRPDGYLTRLPSADDEHTVPGKQMLLIGDTSTRLQVWDAVRSLDYLAAHPLVDPKRLASTGNSGGGTLTMLLAAVDDRLAAAAISCPNTENHACANFNPPGSTDDAEQNLIDGGRVGLTRWDLLYPLAPKPLLVLVSARDFFGTYSPNYIANGREEFGKLRRIYQVLGAGDRVAWNETPLPHGLSHNMRVEIYQWLARWLQDADGSEIQEPPVQPEEDRILWVTKSGNVVPSLGSETPFSLNRKRAARIVTRSQVPDLQVLVRAEMPPRDLELTVKRTVASEGVDAAGIEVKSADRVWLPAWLFLPREQDHSKPVVLALEPSGRVLRWREDEMYQALASEGFPVCLPDLRGLGDLRPEFPRGSPQHGRYHQSEEHYAWASLMLGKPLLGQRVTDVLALATALRNHAPFRDRRLVIMARGSITVPAIFAAALDEKVERLYLAGGLVSYRSIVENEDYKHSFANFLPGVLSQTDLPQVANSLSPREILLVGAVDGSGRAMDVSEVRRVYAEARNVEVRPEEAWNVDAFRRAL